MSNVLVAIKNLIINQDVKIYDNYSNSNRANAMGDALEEYVKDLFSGCYNVNSEDNFIKHSKVFSYLGNTNNPPDMILKNGDAIEVKKIESVNSAIALNSSYPKKSLLSDSTLITQKCRQIEGGAWREKDIIYVIGICSNNLLKGIWFVYGDCYAASPETYQKIQTKIRDAFLMTPNIDFAETKELGRINKVDPLGITYLRIRGMWGIENPKSVFSYLGLKTDTSFFCHALMTKKKYESFPEKDKQAIQALSSDGFTIRDSRIKCPDNPAKLTDIKLLSFNII